MNTLKNTVRVVVTLLIIVSASYADVLPTGQTNCYDASGVIIDCTGTGQDGEFQNEIRENRFIDNNDGTLTDSVTGLTWLSNTRCVPYFGDRSLGQTYVDLLLRLDDYNTYPDMYFECVEYGYANENQFGKYSDWRVPTVEEIKSLLNYGATSVDEYLRNEGFEYPSMTYTDTHQPEWVLNHYMMSLSTSYGGNSIGTWHNTSANGNTTHGTGGLMMVSGNKIPVNPPNLTEIDIDTYKDANTNLTWYVTNERMNWNDALEYANERGLRLPNINELLSLYDFTTSQHLIISKVDMYWSSTSQHNKANYAWVVDFKSGSTMVSRTRRKTSKYYILLVENSTPDVEIPVAPVTVPVENKTGSFTVTDSNTMVFVAEILKDAGYRHSLYAVIGDEQIFLFDTGIKGEYNLGYYPKGTIINFKLAVHTTGYDYYTGNPANNPDGIDHCTIKGVDNIWEFGFEDMYGGGDRDYNDCVFMVTGVSPTEGSEVEVR